jgi:mono/diheme cytochrome c family protein
MLGDTNMHFARLSFAVIGMAVAVHYAQARELDLQHKGRILARQVCGACHAVQAQAFGSPNSRAPSFATIAATPGMTAMALNVFLNTSHRTMPNIIVTPDQTKEIVAYILSLKK